MAINDSIAFYQKTQEGAERCIVSPRAGQYERSACGGGGGAVGAAQAASALHQYPRGRRADSAGVRTRCLRVEAAHSPERERQWGCTGGIQTVHVRFIWRFHYHFRTFNRGIQSSNLGLFFWATWTVKFEWSRQKLTVVAIWGFESKSFKSMSVQDSNSLSRLYVSLREFWPISRIKSSGIPTWLLTIL